MLNESCEAYPTYKSRRRKSGGHIAVLAADLSEFIKNFNSNHNICTYFKLNFLGLCVLLLMTSPAFGQVEATQTSLKYHPSSSVILLDINFYTDPSQSAKIYFTAAQSR